ncbi:unnamed protein product [Spirodela intermedia]|uniref:Uncharacterized protein n=1 Tax=Spirodela intermedia TaxID=51605 RepID=A0A7I8JHQ1_SPIIN|nr:unnamed protein product [Spirodela intermedia]CAA6669676.1 unnamed protein product [Spirodela intermedia]
MVEKKTAGGTDVAGREKRCDQEESSYYSQDGSVDFKGRPAVKAKTGGWTAGFLILVNQGLATLAFFGVGVNLVLFLTRVIQQSNADAANSVSKWTGTVYLFSLVGPSSGLVMLSLSSYLFLVKPTGCGNGRELCEPHTAAETGLFYLSIYMVALGNGGYQPNIATFGADQFDEEDSREAHSKVSFFSYFYLALNLGSLVSNTFLSYFQDQGSWALGFWASAGSAFLGLALFLAGTPATATSSPAATPSHGSRRWWRLHRRNGRDPWRLCTVTQVEEVKCVLRLLPIWLCTIIYSVVFTQMASLFVEQGAAMKTLVGSFRIPPASMSAFDIVSVAVFIFFYRRLLHPLVCRLKNDPKGLTELQRMGVGLIIAITAMVSAGIVEHFRLKYGSAECLHHCENSSSLSIMWQIPQYVLIGASEVFMYVGQLEFFNSQAPDGLKSFGSALCMTSISLGNYVSSILVTIVMDITARGDKPGWIPGNLNRGHMDRFYFLLAAMTSVDFVIYLACARWYKSIRLESRGGDDFDREADSDKALAV